MLPSVGLSPETPPVKVTLGEDVKLEKAEALAVEPMVWPPATVAMLAVSCAPHQIYFDWLLITSL
jgi:hypothetical protein